MERKIGEIFEYNGEWYQCVGGTCRNCSCYYDTVCKNITTIGSTNFGNCHCSLRTDHKSVIFKKLEKVGEPYASACPSRRVIYFQRYGTYIKPIISNEIVSYTTGGLNFIDIEIQTKEDMEEKKLNLKPFNLEAAKAGKPVYTRDGRKARIICFDAIGYRQPVIALITNFDGKEDIETYYLDGRFNDDINDISDYDLMMLPEKKEGWVNVYKGGLLDTKSYPTKKEAFDKACPEDYVATVKIQWEEQPW